VGRIAHPCPRVSCPRGTHQSLPILPPARREGSLVLHGLSLTPARAEKITLLGGEFANKNRITAL
jgi:hypothetical protein